MLVCFQTNCACEGGEGGPDASTELKPLHSQEVCEFKGIL